MNELTCVATKKFVQENFPEASPYFDILWKVAASRKTALRQEDTLKKGGQLSFISAEILANIIEVVVPFLSGVFSAIVADATYDRIKRDKNQILERVERESKRTKDHLKLDPYEWQIAARLIPIIVQTIADMDAQDKMRFPETQRAVSLESILDARLYRIYRQVADDEQVKELLTHIENAHPNFTSHGPDHSKTVINNLLKLIPLNLRDAFSPLEILVLLLAAWLHDIGMADFEGTLAKCLSEEERREMRTLLRSNHASRSRQYILDQSNYQRLLLGPALAQIVGVVCYAHVNEYDLTRIKLKWGPIRTYEEYGEIRTRLLAALFRLADACDLGFQRVKEILMTVYDIPKSYVESIPHLKGGLLISNVLVRGKRIVVQATPTNKQQEEWVKFLMSMLEEDFLSVKRFLREKSENGIELPYDKVIIETLESA